MSPVNPLAAEQKSLERMSGDMHRFNIRAGAPGEIPGEKSVNQSSKNGP